MLENQLNLGSDRTELLEIQLKEARTLAAESDKKYDEVARKLLIQENELENSHFKGALFENMVVSEMLKIKFNYGLSYNLFFWRNNKGVEVDLIIDDGNKLIPVEIKSSQTYNPHYTAVLHLWNSYSKNNNGILIYDGKQEFKNSENISVINWKSLEKEIKNIL